MRLINRSVVVGLGAGSMLSLGLVGAGWPGAAASGASLQAPPNGTASAQCYTFPTTSTWLVTLTGGGGGGGGAGSTPGGAGGPAAKVTATVTFAAGTTITYSAGGGGGGGSPSLAGLGGANNDLYVNGSGGDGGSADSSGGVGDGGGGGGGAASFIYVSQASSFCPQTPVASPPGLLVAAGGGGGGGGTPTMAGQAAVAPSTAVATGQILTGGNADPAGGGGGGGIGTQSASGSLGTAGSGGLSGGQNVGGATIVGAPTVSDLGAGAPAGQNGASGSITFTQVPYVGVSPNSGLPGTAVTVFGSGYRPGETVQVSYQTGLTKPQSVVLCTPTAATDGTFTCNAAIPRSKTAGAVGTHQITATGQTSGGQAATTFTLT